MRADRVDVLASTAVAARVRAIPETILEYFTAQANADKIYAKPAQEAINRLNRELEGLKREIRVDLRTSELDRSARTQ